jgi:hypothetical protein
MGNSNFIKVLDKKLNCIITLNYIFFLKSKMNKSKILFNEKCSVCNFEIKHYKKRSDLNFVNCSEMGDKYLKKLHVRFENGTEISGVDAFVYVWERTKGYAWIAKIIKLPVIYSLSKIGYAVIAFILFYKYKLLSK